MYAFLQSQLDFIYFFYGLTFFSLGVISFLMNRQRSTNVPWSWLSLFGVLHGLSEWSNMVSLNIGENIYWFKILRLFLLTTSFLSLFEFGRQNWNQNMKIKIGLWVYIFLAVPLLFGWQINKEIGLEIFSRCVIGFISSMIAALALWQFSVLSHEHKSKICFGSIAFVLFAFSQFILPVGELFGIKYTNQELFFQSTGVSIQLIRGIFILIVSICVWIHYQNILYQEIKEQQKIYKVISGRHLIYILIGILIVGWMFTQSLGKLARRDEYLENKNIIEVLGGNLDRVLLEGKDLAQVLSGSQFIIELLKKPSSQNVSEANAVLDRYKAVTNVSISYVLDKSGTTLVTSNRNDPDSLLGKNYAFRPYFTGAINGTPSILFAIGVTTKKAGFYASYPVKDEHNLIIGVVVVKMSLAEVEENFKRYTTAFLASPEGVIFLSGDNKFNLSSLQPLSQMQKRQLYRSQQFDKGAFDALFEKRPQDGEVLNLEGGSYLVSVNSVNGEGWSIIVLHPNHAVGLYRLFGILFIFVFYLLTFGFITMAQDIRRGTALSYLASIIYSSVDAIIGKDLEGNIISWNKGAEKIYGYTKEEIIGRSVDVLLPPDKINENYKILAQVKGGKSIEHYETTHLKKSGQIIFVSLTISPIVDNFGVVVGASSVSRDITKEKIAEEMIKYSEKKFNTLFNSISDLVFISDLKGNLLDFNQTMIDVLGYSKNELYKIKPRDIVTTEFAYLVPNWLKTIKQEGSKKFEAALVTKKGVIIPVDISSNLIEYEGKEAVLNSARDITERKITDKILKKQMTELEKFKLAVDSSSDSIIITDKDAHILYANEAVVRMTGFSIDEITGQNVGHLWGGHMQKDFYKEMWHIIKEEKKAFVGDMNNRRKNGEEYIVGVKFYPLLDKQGEVEFFVGVETDITRMKQLERAKSEFISVASHQLRTPLTGIKWFGELLLKGRAGNMSPEQKDYIKQIFDSNDRMIKLVDDLLDVSHIDESGKFIIIRKQEEFSDIVKEVVGEQQIIANSKKIKIEIDPACLKKSQFKVDRSKIGQALQNILNNAIKYSLPGGVINFGCKKDKENLICVIKDHGIGIPLHQQFRIFEKFFRGDNVISTGSGTGLGLYISRFIINAHGGKIWFESKENKGTTFYISLPIK